MRLRDFPTPWCTLRDLFVIVDTALAYPAPDDPLALAVLGQDVAWSPDRQLAAAAVDQLAWLVWAKSKAAADNPNRPPAPIPRPGIEDTAETRHFGSEPVPLDELADWLGWEKQLQQ